MMANYRKVFLPIILLFIIVNACCLVFASWFDAKQVDHNVLLAANLLLFLLTLIICIIHLKSAASNNPHAFVRGVTAASFIKLIVIAVSVIIYITAAGKSRSAYTIVAAMGLYLIYTVLEVKGAMQLNRKQNVES